MFKALCIKIISFQFALEILMSRRGVWVRQTKKGKMKSIYAFLSLNSISHLISIYYTDDILEVNQCLLKCWILILV